LANVGRAKKLTRTKHEDRQDARQSSAVVTLYVKESSWKLKEKENGGENEWNHPLMNVNVLQADALALVVCTMQHSNPRKSAWGLALVSSDAGVTRAELGLRCGVSGGPSPIAT
jgi:hypothetical protein